MAIDQRLELRLLGVGAMNSPRFRPAGLLVCHGPARIMIDGGGSATPGSPIRAWLVSDVRAELMADIRRRCRALGVRPDVTRVEHGDLCIEPHAVAHTSHPAYGYLITCGNTRIVWAPEFWVFPQWAERADLMFADAAGWQHPIRFAHGVGGHAAVWDTAEQARVNGVRRLVFAHIGRPSLRAMDAGLEPPYGEWGIEDATYRPVSPERAG